MKRLLLATLAAATMLTSLASPAASQEDPETAARNHGYDSAALEVTCGDGLIVTDAKLRAKLDKMYRENPRWRTVFLEGYAAAGRANRRENITSLFITCTLAGKSKWLTLDPAARDVLTIRVREADEQRRQK
jgi:hypothetical protein